MKTITQSPRRGVSHTPQMHTPQIHTTQIHTPQIHTPQSNTPNNGLTSDNGVYDITNNGVCDVKDRGVCDTPLRSPSKTLGAIVRGFKSAVTKQIGFPIWQRNYHEHIIRNTNAFTKISNYIRNNPAQWHSDMFNKG